MFGSLKVTANAITDRSTGIPAICYGVTYEDGGWCGGTCSVPAFARWAAEGFTLDAWKDSRDPEYIEAAARVGLEEGPEGEMCLMQGWTWARHDAALAGVNAARKIEAGVR